MARAFRLVNPRMVGASARHDLLVDDKMVLHEVSLVEANKYCLDNMTDEDTYLEEHMPEAHSGAQLRTEHNHRESEYSLRGGYTPKYY